MVTRLSGGLTPADGADPRTFPAIWNATATDIETAESEIDSLQLSVNANGTAITALQGSAVALGSAIDVIEAWDLDDLNDVTIGTAVSDGQVLAYSTAVSGWVNADASGGGGGLIHILTQTIGTAVSSVTVSSAFSSDYDNYLITVSGGTGSVGQVMTLKLGSVTTGYYAAGSYSQFNDAAIFANIIVNNAANFTYAGFSSTNGNQAKIFLNSPNLAKITSFEAIFANNASGSGGAYVQAGWENSSTQHTAFTLAVGGTMTGGEINVYGLAK